MIDRQIHIYEFGNFRLDAGKRLLLRADGAIVPLMPKAFDTLLYLVQNGGKTIEKDEILSSVWSDTIVEENNLTQNISILRRVFGEKPGEHRFIVTVPGRGYKFVAEVREGTTNLSLLDGASASQISNFKRQAKNDSEVENPKFEINSDQIPKTENGLSGRFWLIVLAGAVIAGIATLGFYQWREYAKSAPGDSPIKTIAILPFKPLVPDNRDESLELGMADTLISKLSDGDRITVRPLSAVRRFNSLDQDPVAAGKLLNVEAVLDGGVQIAAGRVRISAKLIRVGDGQQIWSGQFDEDLTHIFAVQDSISERVSGALQIALAGNAKRRSTENVEAYQLYMKGKFHSAKLIMPEVRKGISYYEQAIAIDPNYALPYVELANAYRALVLTNDQRPLEIMPKAKAAAIRAIELDETLAEAHTALAVTSFWHDFDFKTSEKYYLRALEIDPDSPQARFGYAHLLSNIGRQEEALAQIKLARELDPVSLVTNAIEGQILSFAERDDDAIAVLRRTIEMEPNFWLPYLFISRAYLRKEMYAEAIAALSRAKELTGGNAEATASLGYAWAKSGKAAETRAILAELEERSRVRYVPASAIAQLYIALGDGVKALDLLEKGFDEKDAALVFLKIEPKWDELRSEPRFIDLMKRMNF